MTRTGWRRLLQFATSDENVGTGNAVLGGDYFISGHDGELIRTTSSSSARATVITVQVHGARRSWQGAEVVNSKRRLLPPEHGTDVEPGGKSAPQSLRRLRFQGVEVGWVDHTGGTSGQWLDITGFPAGRSFVRSRPIRTASCARRSWTRTAFRSVLAKPVVWQPTGLIAENGEPVEAPRCALSPNWNTNNSHEKETVPPDGRGLITTECTRGQLGPSATADSRCGFRRRPARQDKAVTASFSIPNGAPPQVVRLCEFSHSLGSAIPCRYEDSYVPIFPGVADQPYLGTVIVTDAAPAPVTFSCPAERAAGAYEPGGA